MSLSGGHQAKDLCRMLALPHPRMRQELGVGYPEQLHSEPPATLFTKSNLSARGTAAVLSRCFLTACFAASMVTYCHWADTAHAASVAFRDIHGRTLK